MKTKLLFLFLFFLGFSSVQAETTDISSWENAIYVENTRGVAGEKVTLSVKMKNSFAVPGFQFDLYLPEGFSFSVTDGFYDAKLSTARTTSQKTNTFSTAKQGDGSLRILCATNVADITTGNLYTFSGDDGEVCTITLDIDSEVADGDYTLSIRNAELSDLKSTSHKIAENYYFTVTVGPVVYDEGYNIGITPFEASAGSDYTIALNFNGKDENITDIEFDMELPSFLTRTKSGRATKAFDSADENRMFVSGTDGDHTITVNGNHVTIASIVEDEYKYIAGTKGALVNMYYTASSTVTDGIYPVKFKNVVLKDGDGNVLNVTPTTSYIKVGNPTNQTLALEGLVTEDVNEKLASEASLGTLDLSNVIRMDGTFTVVDGRSFVGPKDDVTVTKATYSREMSNKWGTICLPYEVYSDETASFYQITGIEDDVLNLEAYKSLPAGTPALVYNSGTGINPVSENVTVNGTLNTVSGDVTMIGKYTQDNEITDPDAYYIKRNQFNRCNENFYIDAYRAYFTTTTTSAKVLNLEDIADAINALLGNGDVTVKAMYSTDGVVLNALQRGLNIVVLSNGKTQKVMVK